ncbi:Na+/solute symporter [Hymenopellis radicata]|nr:Na+/solute symporter [Hymenopellis radicata]
MSATELAARAEVTSRAFDAPLPQSYGYGIVLGLGFAFAFIQLALTYVQSRRTVKLTSEEFSTASRSLKPGLVAVGITSAWTHATTLLQSSVGVYQYGVSGAWWYAASSTVCIAIMAALAAKVKMNANGAHTFLEIVETRFGKGTHMVFAFYAFLCALLTGANVLLGSSTTIHTLTGMPIEAVMFLTVTSIILYVRSGGVRASFVMDYLHTMIMFIIIWVLCFTVYTKGDELGSPGAIWDILRDVPVLKAGNFKNSYFTMRSNQGIIFGANNLVGGSSAVFCNQAYWQRAISSSPKSTTKAYMLGGLTWFSIPLVLGTALGLSSRALTGFESYPTYPYVLTTAQQSSGLPAAAAAVALMGKGGAVCLVLMLFMAITSAVSAELVAIASLISYDVYRTHFKPNATGAQILTVQHWSTIGWGLWSAVWCVILYRAGVTLSWVVYIQGVILGSSMVPICLTVCWSKLNKVAALSGTIVGSLCSLTAWLVSAYKIYGEVTVATTGQAYATISGCATAIVVSTSLSVGISLIWPANYDFGATKNIQILDDAPSTIEDSDSDEKTADTSEKRLDKDVEAVDVTEVPAIPNGHIDHLDYDLLHRNYRNGCILSAIFIFINIILIPFPLFFSEYVWSRKFFTAYAVITMIWSVGAGITLIVMPLYEGRGQIAYVLRAVYRRQL